MVSREKLLGQVLSATSDANIPFEALLALLKSLGFRERIKGSHHIFSKDAESPWFQEAPARKIHHVEWPSEDHLYWPELDIDLSVRSIEHPEEFPLKFGAV